MRFFDCNTYIGLPTNAAPGGGVSADELLGAMDRAGIARALVWHVAQRDYHPLAGNDMLAEAIAGRDRLVGCWTILPGCCGELGDLDEWFARAAGANVRAFRAFPQEGRYLLRGEAVGDVLARLLAARGPLILSVGKEWQPVYDLLAEFPELRVILADVGCWGSDRYFRPLIERYPNTYVEISGHMLDGGIEDLVGRYGPGRLLFGTGFPEAYHGAMMLALGRAEIAQADRQAIAAGNIERLLAEAKL